MIMSLFLDFVKKHDDNSFIIGLAVIVCCFYFLIKWVFSEGELDEMC